MQEGEYKVLSCRYMELALKSRSSCWGVNGFDISERLFQTPNMSRPFETSSSKYLNISERLLPSQLQALIENISTFQEEFSKPLDEKVN